MGYTIVGIGLYANGAASLVLRRDPTGDAGAY
jgi:hypothetical protein